ncbi:MAG: hemolysin family protein [Alphaproteobacteria bacterium]|jgi:putative hemolysin
MVALELTLVAVLIVLNGFFAMSEMAIVSSRRMRLAAMAEQGNHGARVALHLFDEPSRFLSAVQIGITLVGTLAAAVSGATLAERLGGTLNEVPWIAPRGETVAFVLVVIAITFLSVLFGELVPKRIALAFPEIIASRVARPLNLIAKAARPLVMLMQWTSATTLWALRIKVPTNQGVTEEEVKSVLAEGAEAGVIEHEERRMMVEVLRLADRSVESIMTPRRDIYWIDLGDGEAKVRDEIRESPFSRILVGQNGSIDEPLGVVLKKTLLDALLAGKPFDVRAALTQPIYVPESATALNLLQLFKSQTSHLAVVVDEYGSIQGVVTPHDLLSAIAGELQEEHSPSTPSVIAREDGSYLVDGRCDLIELEDALGLKTEDSTGFHTAAGLALQAFKRLPRDGEVTQWEGWRIEVVDMDGPRIDKLLFKKT